MFFTSNEMQLNSSWRSRTWLQPPWHSSWYKMVPPSCCSNSFSRGVPLNSFSSLSNRDSRKDCASCCTAVLIGRPELSLNDRQKLLGAKAWRSLSSSAANRVCVWYKTLSALLSEVSSALRMPRRMPGIMYSCCMMELR